VGAEPEAVMWMVSRELQVRAAAEILSGREPVVEILSGREPAVAFPCVAQAGTHERAARRWPLVPGEAL